MGSRLESAGRVGSPRSRRVGSPLGSRLPARLGTRRVGHVGMCATRTTATEVPAPHRLEAPIPRRDVQYANHREEVPARNGSNGRRAVDFAFWWFSTRTNRPVTGADRRPELRISSRWFFSRTLACAGDNRKCRAAPRGDGHGPQGPALGGARVARRRAAGGIDEELVPVVTTAAPASANEPAPRGARDPRCPFGPALPPPAIFPP